MRRLITLIFFVSLAAAIIAVPNESCAAPTQEIVGVDKLMKHVDRYRGPVRVEGVVGAVAKTTLALIDTEEFRKCGVTTCAALHLPVRWTGPMPQLQEVVRVEGEVVESAGKLIFHAQTLEKVTPQPTK